MKKTAWLGGSVLVLSLFLLALYSTPPTGNTHPVKIGILLANNSRLAKVEGLQAGMQVLGYQPDREAVYVVENAQNDLNKLPELANALIATKPDMLVAAGAVEAQTLKALTAQTHQPVVFMGALSPVSLGLVKSTAHPGGNLTGLNNYHQELTPKRLELLHRLLPNIRRVAVVGDTRVPFFSETEKNVQDAAKAFNLDLRTYTISSPEDIEKTLNAMAGAQTEAILLLPGFFLETSTEQIVRAALAKHIPVFGVYPGDTEQGCLASYGVSFHDQGEQSAHMVVKILQGQAPGEVPIETPDKLVFSVNLKTAESLGIHPPASIVSFADNVIQP